MPPLALSVLIDIGREQRSDWARAHARHALFFGLFALIVLLLLAAVPLIIISFTQLATTAILVLYSVSFVIDLLALTAFLLYALRAARGAARGEASTR